VPVDRQQMGGDLRALAEADGDVVRSGRAVAAHVHRDVTLRAEGRVVVDRKRLRDLQHHTGRGRNGRVLPDREIANGVGPGRQCCVRSVLQLHCAVRSGRPRDARVLVGAERIARVARERGKRRWRTDDRCRKRRRARMRRDVGAGGDVVREHVPDRAQARDTHGVGDDLRTVVHLHAVIRTDVHDGVAVVRIGVDRVRADIAAADHTASGRLGAFEVQRVEREQHVAREAAVDRS
jgi:hypothetical protein